MLSTVSHGPSRYPIVRTSWYRLRSPYASLPANLEGVAETWKRLAPSFWAPIASEFFFKTLLNAFLHVHDQGHIGKLEANLSSFKTALTPTTKNWPSSYKDMRNENLQRNKCSIGNKQFQMDKQFPMGKNASMRNGLN